MHKKIKELPVTERPYEKFELYGPASLSDAELLAVIIKTGTKEKRSVDVACDLLELSPAYPGLFGLYHLSLEELKRIPGIGRVKAIQLLCVAELSIRLGKARTKRGLALDNPESVAEYYMTTMGHFTREHLTLVLLDNRNQLITDLELSKGTVNAALINTRDVFIEALRYEAVKVILLHNHPSGDPNPSAEDKTVTRQIAQAGRLMNIDLLDHIIIGDNQYYSFKEHNLL